MTQTAARTQKQENAKTKNNFSSKSLEPLPEGFLFDPGALRPASGLTAEERERRKEGSRIAARLYRIRRESLAEGAGPEIVAALDKGIKEIRFLSRLTNSQMEELVLYAVEKLGCCTAREISENIRLDLESVKTIVEDLKEKNLLYEIKRYVPLSGRQYFALKSARVHTPEAGEIIQKAECSHYSDRE